MESPKTRKAIENMGIDEDEIRNPKKYDDFRCLNSKV